jgi:nucleoid-associated protein YgaU
MSSHFLRKGETAESLSKKYYGTNKKSALILDFNKRFDADTWIYIPFGD